MPGQRRRPALPMVEGWTCRLDGGRLEIFLKVERLPSGKPDCKIRASGTEAQMLELVEWFEEKTGLRVEVPNMTRVRRGPKPIEGQFTLLTGDRPSDAEEESGELSSDATVVTDG